MWAVISFGFCFFARDLQFMLGSWPFGYWIAAQGAVLMFIVIVAVYATVMKRLAPEDSLPPERERRMSDSPEYAAYKMRLHRTVAHLHRRPDRLPAADGVGRAQRAVALLARARSSCFPSVMMYAAIGIYGRTTDPEEYYVAGRRIPAMYNGMAAAADWMSAASFISMAGGLYLQGFGGTAGQAGGLAYVLGWTGGFCLVALLIAPHLRKLNLYTVPDYFSVRYGGRWPRVIAAFAAMLCSFTYVVAQIYGIGLIASRLTGVQFEIGILLGLGGVLLCSFLGGMRAITWTQVAQYIILLLAFLIPVSWLAYKQLGNPLAPLVYGAQLQKISELEKKLAQDPAEKEVAAIFLERAREYEARLQDVEGALQRERAQAQERVRQLKQQGADSAVIVQASRELAALPKDVATARERWTRAMARELRAGQAAGRHAAAQPAVCRRSGRHARRKQEAFSNSRRNFLALMFCLMVGTAGLPHLLTRYYTTPDGGGGALVGGLVAVLHRAGVPERAGAGRAGEVRGDEQPGGQQLRRAAALDRPVGEGGRLADLGGRRQRRRHPAMGRDPAGRRHHHAGHAGARRAALCDLRPGGGRRAGCGAVHRRRAAADHQQRDGARRLLP